MPLHKAHEGYEYQDLLTTYFILKEILNEADSQFIIDRKEFDNDKLDDLLVTNNQGKFKRQIKYSGENSNHTFEKANIAANSRYNLSLDSLYQSWLIHPDQDTTEFRLCLAWNEPIDELKNVLESIDGHQTFNNFSTKVFKILGTSIWPEGKSPLNAWRQFNKASAFIDRSSFLKFCDRLLIEVGLPKFSLNINSPGDLEKLVLTQAKQIGIGVFPNNHLTPETFVLFILAIIKRARSKGTIITTASIFHELNIIVDYGKIDQNFPIIESENVRREEIIENFIIEIENANKVILTGEPGSGKSWFIENLEKKLVDKGIKVIKHYCYTHLNDILQQERIKLNIFYGNLIYDIIRTYPELKNIKEEKYASSLNELNILLENIKEPTYLIVDGLDHIDRIFNFRKIKDITLIEVAIIECIQKLRLSPSVKIVIASQNIPQLDEFKVFKKIIIPNWSEIDIKNLLSKLQIKNEQLNQRIQLSTFLLQKSTGNPLYIKYLIDELNKEDADIEKIPAYSYNLQEYYQYLLSQLNTNEDVPQVLSGVNFSLTKTELEEITDNGDYVSESLKVLSPVLRLNISHSGYNIYHESFRRYIIDELRAKSVSIEKKVFQPVIDWFETKDFFTYRKAYRFNLPFLYENGEFKKIVDLLKYTFVTDSVITGESWELIVKNYKYFVKAACILKDLPNILLLNEIDKILSTTEDNLTQSFSLYIEALGKVRGFNYVSEYLTFEDNPSFGLQEGLEACYVCDENNVAAPWDIYLHNLKKAGEINNTTFGFAIRGLLALKNEGKLNSIAEKLIADNIEDMAESFSQQLLKYRNTDYTSYLCDNYPNIKALVVKKSSTPTPNREDLLFMADEILNFEHLYSREAPVLENFISGVQSHTLDQELYNELIKKFKGKNWFYNWLIYYLKVTLLKTAESPTYRQIKEAFDYLQYTTEPFLGKPRTCDLHLVHYLLYKSFQEGLQLINSKEEWNEIIDLLIKVSNGTTSTLQKSPGGPLTTYALFKLLSEFACENNLGYINHVFEDLTKEKEEYHLHHDIAEYNFRLASLFSAANDKGKAETHFRKAVEYALAYTMRKDATLDDVVEGVEFFAAINSVAALEDLKRIRVLADSVTDHTDGKGTQHYPVIWFEKFLKIDFHKATMFLLSELSNCRYDWRAEKSLADLLCVANGKIDPVVEFYIASTLPISDSEKFIDYRLNLYDILQSTKSIYAEKLIAQIIPSIQPRQHRQFSDNIIDRVNDKLQMGGYDTQFELHKEKKFESPSRKDWYEEKLIERKEFSLMSDAELVDYFEINGVSQNDVLPLYYLFLQYPEITDSLKQLIQLIVRKNNSTYLDKTDVDPIFSTGNEIECFYWVCRFVYDHGGWFEKFVNQEAFHKAREINADNAFIYLFELLPSSLDIGFNIDFSSNLINMLVNAEYDKEKITLMWKNVLEITSYRLPSKDEIKWADILSNELELEIEELLICILICRFKAGTTERLQWTCSGLRYLFEHKQDKLLKPLKWFLSNSSKFLDPALILILQLLLEQKEKGSTYYLNFETQLINISPRHYFLIDFLLFKLIGIPLPVLTIPAGIIYPSLKKNEYDFFFTLNRRFRPMVDSGINLEKIFSKYLGSFRKNYVEYFELYWNRAYNSGVQHIYSSNYLLQLINVDIFNELKKWSTIENEKLFNYAVSVDVESIIAQINSFTLRPSNLLKPFEFNKPYTIINDIQKEDWVRLGHYEVSIKDEGGLKSRQFKSYGGMVFSNSKVDSKLFPYSDYSLFPFHIWGDLKPEFELDKTVVFSIIQEDALEFYNILWLNPTLVTHLNLSVKITDSGLVAINNSSEIVIKMRTWSFDYIGDGYRTSLSDQIPRLQGTDLVIRQDYFDKLSKYFQVAPSYRVVKMEWPIKSDSLDL